MSSKDRMVEEIVKMDVDDLRSIMSFLTTIDEVAPALLEKLSELPFAALARVWDAGAARERGPWQFTQAMKKLVGKHIIRDGKVKLKQQSNRRTASFRQTFTIMHTMFNEVWGVRKDEVSKRDMKRKVAEWFASGEAEMPEDVKIMIAKVIVKGD
jgi:hypothetical protein